MSWRGAPGVHQELEDGVEVAEVKEEWMCSKLEALTHYFGGLAGGRSRCSTLEILAGCMVIDWSITLLLIGFDLRSGSTVGRD